MLEYGIAYLHKGHTLPASQEWLPTKELADKVLCNLRKRPHWKDVHLFFVTRTRIGKELKPCGTYKGKPVYTPDWCYSDMLTPGDYVDQEVVDNFMNAMPPTCMRSDCAQLGEAYSSRLDEDGKIKNTYWTFRHVEGNVWKFCGDCFRGENIPRGRTHAYLE